MPLSPTLATSSPNDGASPHAYGIPKSHLFGIGGLAACGDSCDGCSSCGNLGGGRVEDFYRPYIDGEKELHEINAEYRRGLVK